MKSIHFSFRKTNKNSTKDLPIITQSLPPNSTQLNQLNKSTSTTSIKHKKSKQRRNSDSTSTSISNQSNLNEKVIGVKLKEVPTINNIPYPIYIMLERLSSQWEDIILEGLFRVPGDNLMVKNLKTKFENGENVNLSDVDIHTVCSLLKAYLGSIPEMLVNNDNVCFSFLLISNENK